MRAVIIMLLLLPVAARASAIPQDVQDALREAYKTHNSYVIQAVTSKAMVDHPDLQSEIGTFIVTMNNEDAKAEAEAQALAAKQAIKSEQVAEVTEEKSPWSGELEAGILFESGNSEAENLHLGGKVNFEEGKYGNTLKFKATNRKEEGARTKEEYRISDQARLDLSEVDYAFAKASYVDDRFSGIDLRTTGTLGYGYRFYDEEDFKLNGEVGAGIRYTEETDGTEETEPLFDIGGNLETALTDTVDFTQSIESAIGTESVVTQSTTAITTDVMDNIALRFKVDMEHISNVPPGNEKLDTVTSLTLVYGF